MIFMKNWLGGAVTPTSASAQKEPTAEGHSSLSEGALKPVRGS